MVSDARTRCARRGRGAAVEYPKPLLQPPQKGVPLAQQRRKRRVEVAAPFQRRESGLRLGRSHARIPTVLHLEPLNRELDVDKPSTAHLQIVSKAPRGPALSPELVLHACAEVV